MKLFSFAVAGIILLGSVTLVSAASFALPNIPCPAGLCNPIPAGGNPVGEYIARFYQIAIAIAGILAVAIIVTGSLFYTFSGGSTDRQREGKDMITSALWGIALLFGSYLILNTINPELVTLDQIATKTITPREYKFNTGAYTGAPPLTKEDLEKAYKDRPREVAYCISLVPAPSPDQLNMCITRTNCFGCVGLDASIPMKPKQCQWGREGSDCKVNTKTNDALKKLNAAIPGKTGIVVKEVGVVGRDIKMNWEVTEAFPPTVYHKSDAHYNGCAVDIAVIVGNSRSLSGWKCDVLNQFIKAAEAAGFDIYNEYGLCGGATRTHATGNHLHLTTKNCP